MKLSGVFVSIMIICCFFKANAQSATVTSTGLSPNYSVNINLTPVAVLPNTMSCGGGYNYDVRVKYTITVTGTMPSNLYTLQGNMACVNSGGGYFPLPKTGSATGFVNTNGNAWRSVSDCNTATPFSLSCNNVALSISGPGISHRVINMSLAPLPVSLSNVSLAQVDPVTFKLDWTTAEETNNNYFTIEKSSDAQNWSLVETVQSKNSNGNTPQEYSSTYKFGTEEAIAPNTRIYFRLSQTDLNGETKELKIVSIAGKSNDKDIIVTSSEGKTMVYTGREKSTVELYSMDGRKVFSENMTQAGWTEIDNSRFNAGIFFVRVIADNEQVAAPVKVLIP